jgi:hypothetical protein
MRKQTEPQDVLDARQRITAAKRRVARQEKRVALIKREGRNASRAEALLKILVRRQHRSQQYLDMVVGWWRKHRGSKFPRALRNQFMGPRSARETDEQRRTRWDRDVRAFLDRQYPNAPNYKGSLIVLWEKYLALKLPTEHFVTEFTSGKKAVIFQRAWEMMVARHLDAQGYAISTKAHGPDFRFEHDGRTFWVEAVSPEPMGVPGDYLEGPKPGEFKVGNVPHEEVRRRWTAAVKDKAIKLAGYKAKDIVSDDDVYIIAVNGCQLGALPIHHGVSQLPYAVEAVYPAGPIAIPVDKKTGAFGTQRRPAVAMASILSRKISARFCGNKRPQRGGPVPVMEPNHAGFVVFPV